MPTEIAVPFHLAPDGGIAVTTNAVLETQQHIESLVATSPGERVILANYGVPARAAVFAPDNRVITTVLQTSIASAMSTWEPDVIVNSINAVASESIYEDSAVITIEWSPRFVSSLIQSGTYTSTILIGGDVV